MTQGRKNNGQGQVQSSIIGTEQHYRLSVDSIEVARISCGQYVEHFRSQGATNGTECGKLAVKLSASFGDIPANLATLSPTSLNKRVKSGDITGQTAKAIRWCWSVETRARQMMNVIKAVESTLDATGAATGAASGAASGAATGAATGAKKKALPAVDVVTVSRGELALIANMLDRALTGQDWNEVNEAISTINKLLL